MPDISKVNSPAFQPALRPTELDNKPKIDQRQETPAQAPKVSNKENEPKLSTKEDNKISALASNIGLSLKDQGITPSNAGRASEDKLKSALISVNPAFENNPKLADAVKSLQQGNVQQAAQQLSANAVTVQDKKETTNVSNQLNEQNPLGKESNDIEAPVEQDAVEQETSSFKEVGKNPGDAIETERKKQDDKTNPAKNLAAQVQNGLAAIVQAQANLA